MNYIKEIQNNINQNLTHIKTSICMYSLLNTYNGLICSKFNLDASLLAIGLDNSTIKIFSVTNNPLKSMKSGKDLEKIDKNTSDIYERIIDLETRKHTFNYVGHSASVHALTFDPFNKFFLSASQDSTVRLWDLHLHSNICVYKGHSKPVWDVQLCSKSYYFATASSDFTARLWSTDRIKCVRIFSGHDSDVSTLAYHPNCNYIASGSYDRTVRIWDVVSGNCVRLFSGSTSPISKLKFSNCGRFLIVFHCDGNLRFYDLSNSKILCEFTKFHSNIGTSIFQSHDGSHLYTGDINGIINVYDFKSITNLNIDENNQNNFTQKMTQSLLESYKTKQIPIHDLYYHPKNVLIAAGPYNS